MTDMHKTRTDFPQICEKSAKKCEKMRFSVLRKCLASRDILEEHCLNFSQKRKTFLHGRMFHEIHREAGNPTSDTWIVKERWRSSAYYGRDIAYLPPFVNTNLSNGATRAKLESLESVQAGTGMILAW